MPSHRRIHSLPYFDSREEADALLKIHASETRPLLLPEYRVIREIAAEFSESAREGDITARQILIAYQKLRESHAHTDVFLRMEGSWRKPLRRGYEYRGRCVRGILPMHC